MAKREILNNSKTRLRLFEDGIEMDESLPKHKEYKEFIEKKKLLDEVKRKGVSHLDMTQADIDRLEMEDAGGKDGPWIRPKDDNTFNYIEW